MKKIGVCLLLAAAPLLASAADSDADALKLADDTPNTVARASDWQIYVEAAAGQTRQRNGSLLFNQRLSLDIQFDKTFAPGWRAVFADRLDLNRQNNPEHEYGINSLKEAYLSWEMRPEQLFDLGRINARNGVALGYNPTDYFRSGSGRSIVSADPASQKKNRLGSGMLRSQTLWNGGSLTALYSPKMADQPDSATWNADWGSTNNQNRWLLSLSQKLSENITPQWLLYREDNRSPQLGFNLTGLLNEATVAYVEWSDGRSPSLLAQALNRSDDEAFRNKLSTGLTYTTDNKLSLTAEYQYNGAGLNRDNWDALGRNALPIYAQYRRYVQTAQDMPTRQALFFYAAWQDVLIAKLDLSAMVRHNLDDRSRLSWLEARYRWERTEAAVQLQWNSGGALSEFGASSQQRIAQLLLRHYF
ncbi:MAG: hypothetical protein JSS58_06905 [Proteobacteria bacterium]|nr:hypothetical protein [Pseudomonadota bacterium]